MPKPPNKAPIAKLTGPSNAIVGEAVAFDGSGSSDPDAGGGQVKSWGFDLGIGDQGKSKGNGQPGVFTLPGGYQDAADYDAVLSVFDKPNQKGSTSTSKVTVHVTEGNPPEPPDPVDCVLGDWRLESAGEWSACQPDSTQTRTEIWARDILTEPANGGAPCGPTTDTRTASQACTYVPPPEPEPGTHPYWDTMTADPRCVFSRSLRDQAQLDAAVAKPPSGKIFADPTGKPIRQGYAFSPARDAAELIVEVGNAGLGDDQTSISIPTTQQLRFGISSDFPESAVSLLGTWDHIWDANVRANYGGTTAYKSFKWQLPGDKAWWTMMDHFGSAPGTGDPSVVSTLATEASLGMGPEPDPNVSDGVNFPLCPAGTIHLEGLNPSGSGAPSQRPFGAPKGVRAYHSIWQRYWVLIEMPLVPAGNFTDWEAAYGVTLQPNPNDPTGQGRWYRVSQWMGDAVHGIRRVVFRWPCDAGMPGTAIGVGRFDVEMNTSKRNPLGPISAATRNLVLWRGYTAASVPETDTAVFTVVGL